MLYPLKFTPILKERIWGGNKLKELLGKEIPADMPRCGESWEISGVEGSISVVSNGNLAGLSLNELIKTYTHELVGHKQHQKFGNEFPLLIKFIDARELLSVQVHPNDALAARRHGGRGKTEMWYILDAEKDAQLIMGFSRDIERAEYLQRLQNGTLLEILNWEKVAPGDSFLVPAGRVHATGSGIVLVEIQQTSDITYRIYDWDRVDSNGNPRELHTDLALEAIDFSMTSNAKIPPTSQEVVEIVRCSYFTVNKIIIDKKIVRNFSAIDTFIIYICIEGEFEICYVDETKVTIQKGETALVPAKIKNFSVVPVQQSLILEVYTV